MIERIDREVLIPASLEELWEVITSDGWLAEQVELDMEPGGEARFITGDSVRVGWVEEARSPEDLGADEPGGAVLIFWWSADGEPASRVQLRLDAVGEGATRLTLAESRPLEVLDLVGVPLPESGGGSYGPSLLVAA